MEISQYSDDLKIKIEEEEWLPSQALIKEEVDVILPFEDGDILIKAEEEESMPLQGDILIKAEEEESMPLQDNILIKAEEEESMPSQGDIHIKLEEEEWMSSQDDSNFKPDDTFTELEYIDVKEEEDELQAMPGTCGTLQGESSHQSRHSKCRSASSSEERSRRPKQRLIFSESEDSNHESTQKSVAMKQHFCMFCRRKRTNIMRHLKTIHAGEEEVQKALNLPHSGKKKAIARLVGQGDKVFNDMFPTEKISAKKSRGEEAKVECPSCKKLYSQGWFYRHLRLCDNEMFIRRRAIKREAILDIKSIPALSEGANEIVVLKIKNQSYKELIGRDPFLQEHLNLLVEKSVGERKEKSIAEQIRTICKILLYMMEASKEDGIEINNTGAFFKTEYYKYFNIAMYKLAGGSRTGYRKPSIVDHYGRLFRRFAKSVNCYFSDRGDWERFNEVKEWIELFNTTF